MTTGEKLQRIREEKGISQKDLGVAVGFSKSTAVNQVIGFERNYKLPKKALLKEFAKVLEVNPSVFMGENPVEKAVQQIFWLTSEEREELCQAVAELKQQEKEQELGNITEDELILWKIQWTNH